MAPELRKRKTAPAAAAAGKKAAAVKADGAGKKAAAGGKRKAPEEVSSPVVKKQKSTKIVAVDVDVDVAGADFEAKKNGKKKGGEKKSAPKKKKVVEEKDEEKDEEEEEAPEEKEQEAEEEEDEADEETMALVRAIDGEDDDDEFEPAQDENSFKKGQDVGKIPQPSNAVLAKYGKKRSTKDKSSSKESKKEGGGGGGGAGGEPGVIYVGRLPHGFFEHELRAYFTQFGPVSRLRVSRSKRTGRSRGFAFLEFEEAATAEIAAKTMDNYLLFNHVLKARVVPPPHHPELFKGANRRFKKVPWNKMAGRALERAQGESDWARRVDTEEKRRAARAAKLKETMGYEFEGPNLKAAKAVEQPVVVAVLDAPATTLVTVGDEKTEDEPKELEAAAAAVPEPVSEPVVAEKATVAASKGKKKASKGKKAKSAS